MRIFLLVRNAFSHLGGIGCRPRRADHTQFSTAKPPEAAGLPTADRTFKIHNGFGQASKPTAPFDDRPVATCRQPVVGQDTRADGAGSPAAEVPGGYGTRGSRPGVSLLLRRTLL
ncbi:hypothetical protein BL254_14160 [Protofrankia sp. BMG5.30]|uniref:Uncharacterized protein n=1 Tax=Protofrankia coriariae TaxID=1562887 RepID=A0ABR5F3T2_9ACTN|nr:hypothetical protein FrCorBMG51_12170 [Protofrankia coriariae]ONH34906.1 hypothetical protein BL254_14160 [Protofrankia sp. BMG5.30]